MSSGSLFHKSNKIKLAYPDEMDEAMSYELLKQQANFFSNTVIIKSSHFFPIFYAISLIGLPYSTRVIVDKTTYIPFGTKVWCFCVSSVKLLTFVLFLFTGIIYIPHKMTVFTFYAFGSFTAILTFYLIWDRKKIAMSIRRLCELSHFISPLQTTGNKFCIFQLILLGLFFSYSAFIFKTGIYSLEYSSKFEILGVDLLDVYRISTIVVYLNGVLTSGVTIVFCNNVFVTLRTLVVNFRQRLRERYRIGNYCRKNILEDINLFRRIVDVYQQLEKSMSPILLFLNVLCIVSFLNNLSILLTRRLDFIPMVGIMLTFLQVFVAFVRLTFNGARVINEYESLKMCLIRCSEDVVMTTASVTDVSLFTIFAENIRSVNIQFTAGDMYIIDKGLILTVGGIMVTYGVIEHQLSTIE